VPGTPGAGVELQVVWFEADVIQLRVEAGNGRFAGSTDLCVAKGALARLAAGLHGFPASPADLRDFTLGSFDERFAGGGCRLEWHGAGRWGHPLLIVELRTEPGTPQSPVEERATLALLVAPAIIDRWVEQVQNLEPPVVGARARLDAAPRRIAIRSSARARAGRRLASPPAAPRPPGGLMSGTRRGGRQTPHSSRGRASVASRPRRRPM
jgi:hypothetical protein